MPCRLDRRHERDDGTRQLRVGERDTKPDGDQAAEDRNHRRRCAARHQRDRNGSVAACHEGKRQGEMQPPPYPADKPPPNGGKNSIGSVAGKRAMPATSDDQLKAAAKNSGK